MFALLTVLGLGSLLVPRYLDLIDYFDNPRPAPAADPGQRESQAKRDAFRKKQQLILEKLERQGKKVQLFGPKVEDGRLPGDQARD
jgi:hypothetical protein